MQPSSCPSRRLVLSALAAVAAPSLAETTRSPRPNRLHLATLDWPPYTGSALPAQGASSAVLRAALLGVDAELQLSFMPWARALADGGPGGPLHGYFPAYRSAERDLQSLRSERIGASRVGFAHRRGERPTWRSLDDLTGMPIGVVRGFVNTEDFDRRMRDGRLRTDPATSDEVNLRKLAAGRIALAVIDEAVFHALLAPGGPLAGQAALLQFDNAQLLEEKSLHVYLQRNADGQHWLERLNRGLARIDVDAVFRRSLQ